MDAVSGSDLRLENAPGALALGETYSMNVCADAASTAASDEPRYGLLVLDYGYEPRYLKIPVM